MKDLTIEFILDLCLFLCTICIEQLCIAPFVITLMVFEGAAIFLVHQDSTMLQTTGVVVGVVGFIVAILIQISWSEVHGDS